MSNIVPIGAAPLAIILCGASGCGKSTLGAALAARSGHPYLEGDHFHAPEAVAKMRQGTPLDDDDRWPWLDRLAVAAGKAIVDHGIAIVACSALRMSYRDRLRSRIAAPTLFVLIDCGYPLLADRIAARPSHYMPLSLLASQLATLERPVDEDDVLILDGNLTVAAQCDAVVRQAARLSCPIG